MAPREFYEQLGSSQDRAIELARAGAQAGHRVVVREQTAGRGRDGHRWVSPPGGVYLSVITGPPPESPGLLPLAVGAHLAEALEVSYRVPVQIKWPNDLVISAEGRPLRKLGGVLVDRVQGVSSDPIDVVGVGLNLHRPSGGWGVDLEQRVTSVEEFSIAPVEFDQLEELAYRAVLAARRELDTADGLARVLAVCRRRLFGVGARALVDGRDAGRVSHLADDGALWVRGDVGVHEVRAGDLAIVEGSA